LLIPRDLRALQLALFTNLLNTREKQL